MAIYSVFGTFFIAYIYIYNKSIKKNFNKKKIREFLICMWLFLGFIEGLRSYTVGTDTIGYVREYVVGDFKSYEPLTKILFSFLRNISSNPTFMLIIVSLLINGLILWAIYRESCNIGQSVFLYVFMLFYFVSFNALRQALAYAFVINAFISAKNKKVVSYLFFLIIAVFIHDSALIGIMYSVIFLIKDEKNTIDNDNTENRRFEKLFQKNVLIIVGTVVASFLSMKYLNIIIMKLLPIFPRYAVYLTGDYSFFSQISGGVARPIIYTLIFICFIFIAREGYQKKVYIIPLLICVVLAFVSYKIAYMERFMYYFDIICVLAIPYMFNNNCLNGKSKILFRWSVQFSISAYCIYMLSYGFMRVRDYAFIWTW